MCQEVIIFIFIYTILIIHTAKPHLTTIKKQTKDIWDEEELAQGTEFNDEDDPRPEPKYFN